MLELPRGSVRVGSMIIFQIRNSYSENSELGK